MTYPWDEWLDGNEHVLRQGEDFDCQPRSMIVAIQRAARHRGGHCRPAECDDGNGPGVWFQFRPGPYRSPDLVLESYGRPERACPHPEPLRVPEKWADDIRAIAAATATTPDEVVARAIARHVADTRRAYPHWFGW